MLIQTTFVDGSVQMCHPTSSFKLDDKVPYSEKAAATAEDNGTPIKMEIFDDNMQVIHRKIWVHNMEKKQREQPINKKNARKQLKKFKREDKDKRRLIKH